MEDVTEFVSLQRRGSEQEKLTEELRTSVQQIEAEVCARALQLEEANRRRLEWIGRLAGGVAHDFNNLLGVILSCAELLGDRIKDPSSIRNGLEHIQQAAQNAASLTRQLLAYSRQQVPQPQVLALNGVIEKLAPLLRRLLGEGVEIQTNLDTAVGNIKADEGQIEQVLMNMSINARDATGGNGKLVMQTAICSSDESGSPEYPGIGAGEHLLFMVSDPGPGIDRSLHEKIFEPFFTTKERRKGTGLGLATVYGIAKQNGGHIWVQSEPGEGATFKLCFPRGHKAAETATPQPGTENCKRSSAAVLIVEDQEMLVELLQEMLKAEFDEVLTAENPKEALKLATSHVGRIDLLITDVIMPGMNGRAFADKFAELHPNAKVLFMSGYTQNLALDLGPTSSEIAFLQKPFTKNALTCKV